MAPRAVAEDHRDLSLRAVPGARVKLQADLGPVEVLTRPGDSIDLSLQIRAEAAGDRGAQRMVDRVEVTTSAKPDQVEITVRSPDAENDNGQSWLGIFRRRGTTLRLRLRVEMPPDQSLELAVGAGAVRVGDLQGNLIATTGSGDLTVGRVGGSLEVRMGSGALFSQAVQGPSKVRVGSGGVVLEEAGDAVDVDLGAGKALVRFIAPPGGPSRITTGAGGVGVEVAEGVGLDVEAGVEAGRILTRFSGQTQDRPRSRYRGAIHGGGASLKVFASTGVIYLAPLPSPG